MNGILAVLTPNDSVVAASPAPGAPGATAAFLALLGAALGGADAANAIAVSPAGEATGTTVAPRAQPRKAVTDEEPIALDAQIAALAAPPAQPIAVTLSPPASPSGDAPAPAATPTIALEAAPIPLAIGEGSAPDVPARQAVPAAQAQTGSPDDTAAATGAANRADHSPPAEAATATAQAHGVAAPTVMPPATKVANDDAPTNPVQVPASPPKRPEDTARPREPRAVGATPPATGLDTDEDLAANTILAVVPRPARPEAAVAAPIRPPAPRTRTADEAASSATTGSARPRVAPIAVAGTPTIAPSDGGITPAPTAGQAPVAVMPIAVMNAPRVPPSPAPDVAAEPAVDSTALAEPVMPEAPETLPTSSAFAQAVAKAAAGDATPRAPDGLPVRHAERIAVAIHQAVAEGVDRIRIRLWPAELGHVDLTLHVADDRRTTVSIAVERPETLDLLQRDARGLERALADAGLKTDTGSLAFNLRQGSHGFDNAPGRETRPEPVAPAPIVAAVTDAAPYPRHTDPNRIVDLHA